MVSFPNCLPASPLAPKPPRSASQRVRHSSATSPAFQVEALAHQPLPAQGDVDSPGTGVHQEAVCSGDEVLETPALLVVLGLGAIAEDEVAGLPPLRLGPGCFFCEELLALGSRVDRQVELLRDGLDGTLHLSKVPLLVASGGGVHVVGVLGDPPCPARGGLGGHLPLPPRPLGLVVVLACRTPSSDIACPEGGEVPREGTDDGQVRLVGSQPPADAQGGDRGRLLGALHRVADPAAHETSISPGCDNAIGPTSLAAQRSAFSARFLADLRP